MHFSIFFSAIFLFAKRETNKFTHSNVVWHSVLTRDTAVINMSEKINRTSRTGTIICDLLRNSLKHVVNNIILRHTKQTDHRKTMTALFLEKFLLMSNFMNITCSTRGFSSREKYREKFFWNFRSQSPIATLNFSQEFASSSFTVKSSRAKVSTVFELSTTLRR